MLHKPDLDLLYEIGSKIKTGWELCGSRWQNCEAETIALQTLSASALNHRKHGDAFSWQGNRTLQRSGNGLADNPRGIQLLLDDGMITLEPREGTAPNGIVQDEHGKPMVIRVTRKLVHYAASKIL